MARKQLEDKKTTKGNDLSTKEKLDRLRDSLNSIFNWAFLAQMEIDAIKASLKEKK